MIARNNIESLLSQWNGRLTNEKYSEEYRCALGECIYELQELLGKIIEEENANLAEVIASLPSSEVEDYLYGLEADEYFSSLESHTA